MSIVLNMVGGGGGGEKPQIIATAPTGSTVVATKGTVTVSAQEDNGTWTFKLPEFGEWTVTATKDGESASDTVDVQQDYSATLAYRPTASLTPTSGITYTDGIATLTAEQMSLYGEAISNNAEITNTTSIVYIDHGAEHYKVSVGDSINIEVSGVLSEFIILGFNHDDLTDETSYGSATATEKAGFTLSMRACLDTIYAMNATATNVGGWNGCALRATLQGTIKDTMNSAWQGVIKTVKKMASARNKSATIITSNDSLFLLSEIEINNTASISSAGEGSQYAWYAAGNPKTKTAVSGTTFVPYWYRSPYKGATSAFCLSGTDGSLLNRAANLANYSTSFAMCI